MLECLAGLLGLILGLTWTRHAGRCLGVLLRHRSPGAAIAAATVAHLLPVVVLLGVLVPRAPAATVAALAGYWCGRTAWLAYVATGHGWEESRP